MCHIFLNLLQESLPRLPSENFYYSQEDAVFEIAAKRGFTWSVARPGLIVGFATKTEVLSQGLWVLVFDEKPEVALK